MGKRAIAALALMPLALAATGGAADAGCKTKSYGYVGFSKSGASSFARGELEEILGAWKKQNPQGRAGKISMGCKPYPIAGEWECHARAQVCK